VTYFTVVQWRKGSLFFPHRKIDAIGTSRHFMALRNLVAFGGMADTGT
jgi:hypothetical protein